MNHEDAIALLRRIVFQYSQCRQPICCDCASEQLIQEAIALLTQHDRSVI